MTSLASLEPEVVFLIAEYLDDSSPKSTKALACVSKYLNEITKLITHRHKTVDIEESLSSGEPVKLWDCDSVVAANIRTLTIKGFSKQQSGIYLDVEYWEPLVRFLSRIGRLRQLNWNMRHPLPLPVLDAFEQYQTKSSLRIFDFVRASPYSEELDEVEGRLARSSALTHLRQTSSMVRLQDPSNSVVVDAKELAFRHIAGSAENLVYVGLIVPRHFRTRVLSVSSDDHQARIRGAFQINKRPSSSVRQLTLDGVNISRRVLEEWSTFVDLSKLHSVKFSRGTPSIDYFQCAASILSNLKHLSLNLFWVHSQAEEDDAGQDLVRAIADYVKACSPLQTLSLWSWIGIVRLRDILQRHGQTLEHLQLHERDHEDRKLLSVAEIIDIRDSCPRLREFTFDLPRKDPRLHWETDVNKQYFEELAKFPNLNSLQIYFDVGIDYLWDVHHVEEYDYDEHSEIEVEIDSEDNRGYAGDAASINQPSFTTTQAASSTAGPQDDDNNDNINNSSSPANASSPAQPAKRIRTHHHIRPSRDSYLEAYAINIWKTVFQNKAYSPRRLDIKIGDWEGVQFEFSNSASFAEWQFRRHIVVRPHERDDVFEPSVVVHKLKPRGRE